jgi:acetyltransferase-like isoleucine patch superfamily enzyme
VRIPALPFRRRLPAGVQAAPGVQLGRGVRFAVAPGARVVLGPGCRIGDGSRFEVAAGEVRIGAGASLGERCVVTARVRIDIGAGVRAGDDVLLTDSSRSVDDVERPVRLQGLVTAPVAIGDGATLGARACVLPGVTVGARAVLEAGSVAERDVPAGAEAVGVPARPPRPAAPPRAAKPRSRRAR